MQGDFLLEAPATLLAGTLVISLRTSEVLESSRFHATIDSNQQTGHMSLIRKESTRYLARDDAILRTR